MQKTYSKDNSVLLRRILCDVGGITLLILVLISGYPTPKEVKLFIIVPWWLLGAYGYFGYKNGVLWIKLGDEKIEYYDSKKNLSKTYYYKDIEIIDNYWGGFRLRFKKGYPEKSIQIGTSPFKNSRELKKELRQRWSNQKETEPRSAPRRSP